MSSGVAAFQRLAGGPITIVVRDILYLEPLLPLLVIVVLVLAVRRTEVDSLVAIAVFGGVLVFEAYAQFLLGPDLRLVPVLLMAVPLMVVLATLLWPIGANPFPAGSEPKPPMAGVYSACVFGTSSGGRRWLAYRSGSRP